MKQWTTLFNAHHTMQLIALDFETYYDKDFSLSKMTTEEYIRDERFEVIGVAVKVGEEEPVWCAGSRNQIKSFLSTFPWDNAFLLAHNTMFDGAILSWQIGRAHV